MGGGELILSSPKEMGEVNCQRVIDLMWYGAEKVTASSGTKPGRTAPVTKKVIAFLSLIRHVPSRAVFSFGQSSFIFFICFLLLTQFSQARFLIITSHYGQPGTGRGSPSCFLPAFLCVKSRGV